MQIGEPVEVIEVEDEPSVPYEGEEISEEGHVEEEVSAPEEEVVTRVSART